MRKQQLKELKVGDKVISKKDNSISTVTGIADKVELDNNKQYSQSTMIRWYDLYVEEPVQPIQPTIIEEKHEDDQLHDDTNTTTKKDVVEGDTTTPGQQIFENSISGVVIQHGCHLNRMKEYVAVRREGIKGNLIYIRKAKVDGYWHFDIKQKVWNSISEDYRQIISNNYYADTYDKTRKLFRVGYCDSLEVFKVLLLTALSIA